MKEFGKEFGKGFVIRLERVIWEKVWERVCYLVRLWERQFGKMYAVVTYMVFVSLTKREYLYYCKHLVIAWHAGHFQIP